MNTFTYTVTAAPAALAGTKTKSQSLTGTTDVTFSLSGLSAYDATTAYRMNKVVVDFDDGEELVITRPLSETTIPSLTGNTFKHVIQTDIVDQAKRHVYFTIYRDDMKVDVVDLKFTMFQPPITTYEDINLLKTDYFNNDNDDEKMLLTFINKNPEVLGISLLDLDIPAGAAFNPSLALSQGLSANEFNVGFTTEYVQTQASDSNTGGAIQVNLGNNLNAMGLPKENGKVSFKWRTRAAEPDVSGNTNAVINLPNNPTLFYIPLTANSGFVHLSGFLTWNCNDLLKDIDLSTKTITVPLLDITGTKTTFNLSNYYFTNVNVGVGTSMTGLVSGGYFYVDLYDITGCDSLTTTTSTITAFVNY
tara:strand:+ start:550 stop:1635 length:1086 start_codon:yes stop_codon:yes gene_type:complete